MSTDTSTLPISADTIEGLIMVRQMAKRLAQLATKRDGAKGYQVITMALDAALSGAIDGLGDTDQTGAPAIEPSDFAEGVAHHLVRVCASIPEDRGYQTLSKILITAICDREAQLEFRAQQLALYAEGETRGDG